jgi:DNA-binding FadR family transcriptional regulator
LEVPLSIRRGTGLGRNTLREALRMLKEGDFIVEDEKGLFWVSTHRDNGYRS